MPVRIDGKERISKWSIPEPNSGCWIWVGSLNRDGYGTCGRPFHLAHRLSYVSHIGVVPDGLEIDHKCRVRCCVNPDHLEAVTHLINVRRGIRVPENHRNARKTHCKNGHELVGNNLVSVVWNGRPARKCRECRVAAQRQRNPYARYRLIPGFLEKQAAKTRARRAKMRATP